MQLSIKKSKISNFFSLLSWIIRKKCRWKNLVWRGGLKIFQKKGGGRGGGGLDKKGVRKNRCEGCDPRRNYGWDHCHRLYSEKGWISSKIAVVQHLFLYQNYHVATSLLNVMAVAN